MKTLYQSVNTVLDRLDDYPADNGEQVWTRSEVELYLEDGYNAFCRQTRCVFDLYYPENVPTCGSYVARWERDYFASGMIATGLINYTGGYWERDYAQAGDIGPVNSTQLWEGYYEYVLEEFAVSLKPIPEETVVVDRGTYDFGELQPEWSQWVLENDRDYQETSGEPTRFVLDRDGMSWMRIVPAGSAGATQVATSGNWGLIRDAADTDGLGTWSPAGSWGILREIPEHFPMGGRWGLPRRLYSDSSNVRLEYFRLGKDLDEYAFEIPDRFTKYVEYYAQAKCLERDGPGQDIALSVHFLQRFQTGVDRMIQRITENKRPRKAQIGSVGKGQAHPALARLPYRYGRQIRRGAY